MAMITVVVPVYKVPFDYLDTCINSIISQTFRDIEIILVDDGSPKEWADKCDSYLQLDNRIKVVHKTNGGLSDARNKGLSEATARWITFIDGDDWVELNFLQLAVDRIRSTDDPADIYMFSGFRNYPEKQVEGVPHYPDGTQFLSYIERENLQTKCFTNHIAADGNIKGITISSGCMKVFNVDYLKNNDLLFPIVPYDEDSLFYLDSIEKANKVEYVAIPVYHYRFTEGSIVNCYRPNAVHEQELYLGYIFDFIAKNNKTKEFTAKAYMRVMTSMLLLIKQYFFHPSNTKSFIKKQLECSAVLKKEPYCTALKELDTSLMRKNVKMKFYMLKAHMYLLVESGRKFNQKKIQKKS